MHTLPLLLLVACTKPDVDTDVPADTDVDTDVDTDTDAPTDDADGDGSPDAEDCADTDASVHPGATEIDDGVDQDCDGWVDEDFVAPGDLLFTEVMTRGTASPAEWIEVHNGSARAVALDGLTLDVDGVGVVLPALTLPPGGYAVIGDDDDPTTNGGVAVDLVVALPELDDAGATIGLVGAAPLAALDYGAGSGLVAGASIGLDPTRYDPTTRGQRASWCAGTAPFGDGDAGSPGRAHELCAHVDHDGDGASSEDGDCDDADPSVSPDAPDDFDGRDDDCDGVVDVVKVPLAAVGYLEAGDAEDLGWRGLSRGDLDDDGALDLVISAPSLGARVDAKIYLIPAAGFASFAGDPAGEAATVITVDPTFGYLGPRQGDADGDGDDDLVAIGWYRGASLLMFEGPLPSGSLDADDADLWVSDAASATEGAVLSDVDSDGDGACGLIAGVPADANGRVAVWTGAPGSGRVSWSDADAEWTSRGERLGRALGAGDFDGDGADDVAVSDYTAGTVYIVPADKVGRSGQIGVLAAWSFDVAPSAGAYGGLAFGDLDGDEVDDFVLGEPFAPAFAGGIDGGRVSLWYGGLAPGAYRASTADLTIAGDGFGTIYDFGHEVGVIDDPFGTGPLLVASSPVTGSPSSWMFAFDVTTAATWKDAVASLRTPPGASDSLGHRFFADDLDDDGDVEWVIAAPSPNTITDGGTVWFLEGP